MNLRRDLVGRKHRGTDNSDASIRRKLDCLRETKTSSPDREGKGASQHRPLRTQAIDHLGATREGPRQEKDIKKENGPFRQLASLKNQYFPGYQWNWPESMGFMFEIQQSRWQSTISALKGPQRPKPGLFHLAAPIFL